MDGKRLIIVLLLLILGVAACAAPPEPTPSPTPSPIPTDSATAPPTDTPTATETPTASDTATITLTPTETLSPTPSNTPTPEPVIAIATRNGNCRVGPGEAYIPVAVFDEGHEAKAQGRDYDGDWVWLQPPDFNQRCWVHAGNMEFSSELRENVPFVVTSVSPHPEVPAPTGVTSQRNGNTVTFSWNAIPSAPEVGYLIEARQCLNGNLVDFAYATGGTSITLNDTGDCGGGSYADLYGKNKLGYSTSVRMPYP